MSDLRLSQIAAETSLSIRYWQRRAMAGDLPGASYIEFGHRRTYLVDADTFRAWWSREKKPCQKILGNAAGYGGTGSPKTALRTKVRFKQETSDSLKSALRLSEKI